MHHGHPRRLLLGVAIAAIVGGLVPAIASAAAVTKYSDHYAVGFCDGQGDGAYLSGWLTKSTAFGDEAGVQVWPDGSLPFEDPPAVQGVVTSVDRSDVGTETILTATIDLGDAEGNPIGTGTFVATLEPDGPPHSVEQLPMGNHHSRTSGSIQPLLGSATLTWDGQSLTVSCGGERADVSVQEANPTAFIFNGSGISLECFWDTGDAVAGLFVGSDGFGSHADGFVETAGLHFFPTGNGTSSIDAGSMTSSFELADDATGEVATATASATFALLGGPVTSVLVTQTSRAKAIEQALVPTGTIDFSTGQSFVLDATSCRARTYASHSISTAPSGPKGGQAPANDAPSGAIALRTGSKVNVQTTGAAPEAEQPIATCPDGPGDNLGRTVWFRVVGTGAPLTLDTSGSNFDTVIAAYTSDGSSFTEVGCEDDVSFQPIGESYQAVLTIPTLAGVTYWIQAGGYLNPFAGAADAGRLRLAIR